jgi:hypothetical protein
MFGKILFLPKKKLLVSVYIVVLFRVNLNKGVGLGPVTLISYVY